VKLGFHIAYKRLDSGTYFNWDICSSGFPVGSDEQLVFMPVVIVGASSEDNLGVEVSFEAVGG
jgi:hypothetical protein